MLLKIAIFFFFIVLTSSADVDTTIFRQLVMVETDLHSAHIIFVVDEDDRASVKLRQQHIVASFGAIAYGSTKVKISSLHLVNGNSSNDPRDRKSGGRQMSFRLSKTTKDRIASYCEQIERAVNFAIESRLRVATKIFVLDQRELSVCDMSIFQQKIRQWKSLTLADLTLHRIHDRIDKCSGVLHIQNTSPFHIDLNLNEKCGFMEMIHTMLNFFSGYPVERSQFQYEPSRAFKIKSWKEQERILHDPSGASLVITLLLVSFLVFSYVFCLQRAIDLEIDFRYRHNPENPQPQADPFDVEDVDELVRRFPELAEGVEEELPPIVLPADHGEPRSFDEKLEKEKNRRMEAGGNEYSAATDMTQHSIDMSLQTVATDQTQRSPYYSLCPSEYSTIFTTTEEEEQEGSRRDEGEK